MLRPPTFYIRKLIWSNLTWTGLDLLGLVSSIIVDCLKVFCYTNVCFLVITYGFGSIWLVKSKLSQPTNNALFSVC